MVAAGPDRSIRLLVAVPPRHYFGGNDRENALSIVKPLKSRVPNIFLFDCDVFLSGSKAEFRAQMAAARRFQPSIGLGLPNAGYGLLLNRPSKDQQLASTREPDDKLHIVPQHNVFTDELGIPLILLWDHLITQAPQFFLGNYPVKRESSRTGCISALRAGLGRDNFVHHVPDSGHIEVFDRLGIFSANSVNRYVVPAHDVFLNHTSPSQSELITDRILFAGNLGSKFIASDFGDDSLVQDVQEFIIDRKRRDWTVAAWSAYEEIAQQKHASGIAELHPDHSFFWSLGRELLNNPVLLAARMAVFKSLKLSIDFYGGFADPEFVSSIGRRLGQFRAMGSVPLGTLGSIYQRYQFSVDMTHTPFMRGSNAKVLDCFASGGFMFVDWRHDLRGVIGDAAEEFMYRSADDLNHKIEVLRGNSKRRSEIIEHVQNAIRRKMTFLTLLDTILRQENKAASSTETRADDARKYHIDSTQTIMSHEEIFQRIVEGQPCELAPVLIKNAPIANMFVSEPIEHNQSKVITGQADNSVTIIASGPRWSYASSWCMQEDIELNGPFIIELRLRVSGGSVGLGCVVNDLAEYVDDELIIEPRSELQTIRLSVEAYEEARHLVLRNTDPTGRDAMITIYDLCCYEAVAQRRNSSESM